MKAQVQSSWTPQLEKLPASSNKQQALRPAEKPKVISQVRRLTGEVAMFETDAYGFITSWDRKAEQVYGFDFDDVMGKHIASLYPVGDLLHGKPIHEMQAVESGKSYFSFGWQVRKSGQEFWSYSEFQSIKDTDGMLVGYRKFVMETPTSIQS